MSLYELNLLRAMPGYNFVEHAIDSYFGDTCEHRYSQEIYQEGAEKNIFFKYYPELQKGLSYISLADLPTPLILLEQLSSQFPDVHVFMKHDGMMGKIGADGKRMLGANKLRKLPYLFGDAKAHGHDTVLTFGCAGSNHAMQTAFYAKQLGMTCICMLKPQPNAYVVRKNLLLQKASGSLLNFSLNNQERAFATLDICRTYKQLGDMMPYIIPTGGSVARGAIGYVEAIFELKEQIAAGLMPEPDHIYVTLGSGGTAAGILLGCKAAGISSKIHLVMNEPEDVQETWLQLHKLYTETNNLLRSLDASFALYELKETDCVIVDAYAGTEYGLFTQEAVEAMQILKDAEGLQLDGVYTGKCFTALLADLRAGKLAGSNVLFWNTCCTDSMEHITDDIDYRELPHALHTYFIEDVQLLDRK